MKKCIFWMAIALWVVPAVRLAAQDGQGKADPLPWAYGVTPPPPPATPPAQPDTSLKHVPNSKMEFTFQRFAMSTAPLTGIPKTMAKCRISSHTAKSPMCWPVPLPLSERQGPRGKCRRLGTSHGIFHQNHDGF